MVIQVPLWGVLLVSLLLFVAVSAYFSLVIYRRPGWLDFTKMMHEERLFEWGYDDDSEPMDFRELCPKCECELDGNDCPPCGWSRPFVHNGVLLPITRPIPGKIKKIVEWHIKNGTYKDMMAEIPPCA